MQLTPSPVLFSSCTLATPEAQQAFTPANSCFTSNFWESLVQHKPAHQIASKGQGESCPLPNVRLIFRGGGSDFDDTGSCSVTAGLAQVRGETTRARQDLLLHSLRHIFEQMQPAAPLPFSSNRQKGYALFCAGDENYLYPAIVALESTRRRTGQADAFFVTDAHRISGTGKELLHKHHIEVLHSDEGKKFNIKHMHTTPEAYVQFFVPEALYERGYNYSLGLHADIICVQPFCPNEIFVRTSFVAMSGANPAARTFSITDNHTVIEKAFGFSPRNWLDPLNNPGVFFANNAALAKIHFSRLCRQAYTKVAPEFLFWNEESLLNFFCMLDKEFCIQLDDKFNMFNGCIFSGNVPYFLHYLNRNKPWRFSFSTVHHSDNITPLTELFSIWHREAKSILGEYDYSTFITASGV